MATEMGKTFDAVEKRSAQELKRDPPMPTAYDAKNLDELMTSHETPTRELTKLDSSELSVRLDAAKAAAPYVHPRLSPKQEERPPVKSRVDITKFNNEELILFERLMAKALLPAPPAIEDDDDTKH